MMKRPVLLLVLCAACSSEPAVFEVGAATLDVSPTEYELFLDCGRDALCEGDEGWEGPDEGEGNFLWDAGEAFLDCGVDRLCEGDEGYPGPDRGEDDGVFQELRLAGFDGSFPKHGGRPVQGNNDPLEISVIAMRKGEQKFVLVEVDTVGFFHRIANAMRREIASDPEIGVDIEDIVIAATHTHNGPDTMGIWSPLDHDQTWTLSLIPKVKETVKKAVKSMKPARLHSTQVELPSCRVQASGVLKPMKDCIEPPSSRELKDGPDLPILQNDLREPYVRDMTLTAARFEAKDGSGTISTLISWSSHPEALGSKNSLTSADFPGYARRYVREKLGGHALYASGAVGGMMSPLNGAEVPRYSEDGQKLEGWVSAASFEKVWSLGYTLGEYAVEGLKSALVDEDPELERRYAEVDLPVEMMFQLAFTLHPLLDEDDGRYDPRTLSVKAPLTLVRVGPLSIATMPGELLPEFWIGRKESTYDYSAKGFGPWKFPAMPGVKSRMPGKHPMVISLANEELGYLIPEQDFIDSESVGRNYGEHPNFYEESVSPGKKSATLLCDALLKLAGRSDTCFEAK